MLQVPRKARLPNAADAKMPENPPRRFDAITDKEIALTSTHKRLPLRFGRTNEREDWSQAGETGMLLAAITEP